MALAAPLLLAASMAHGQPTHLPRAYVRDQVLIRFDRRVLIASHLTPQLFVSQAFGGDIVKPLDHTGELFLVRLPLGLDVDTVLSQLETSFEVKNQRGVAVSGAVFVRAERNFLYRGSQAPSDACFSEQWALDPAYAASIHAMDVWPTTKGNGVAIGVIDTGVDNTHPDLADQVHRNSDECQGVENYDDDCNGFRDDCFGYNAVANAGDAVDMPAGNLAHGTHVAGIIAAAANDAGVVGVSPEATLVICKALNEKGVGTTADVIDCLHYISTLKAPPPPSCAGVKPTPMPIAVTNNSYEGPDYSVELRLAIERQQKDGTLFVAAAGNDSRDIGQFGAHVYPASYEIENIVAVAAIDSSGGLLGNSNYGSAVTHLVAPGGSIVSTQPANATAQCGGVSVSGAGYASGTSMAAPQVAGVAALVAAGVPTSDWKEIKRRLVDCGVPDGLSPPATKSGRRLDAAGALGCP